MYLEPAPMNGNGNGNGYEERAPDFYTDFETPVEYVEPDYSQAPFEAATPVVPTQPMIPTYRVTSTAFDFWKWAMLAAIIGLLLMPDKKR